jgi:hypothetical protein
MMIHLHRLEHLIPATFAHPTAPMKDDLPLKKTWSNAWINRVQRIENELSEARKTLAAIRYGMRPCLGQHLEEL